AEWHNTQFYGLRSTRATRQGRWKPITKDRKNNTPATPTLTQAGANTTSISSSRRDAITTSFRAGLSRPGAEPARTAPVCRYADNRQSGVFQGEIPKGDTGVLPKGGGLPYWTGRTGKYRVGGGTHGRENAPP